MEGTHRSRRARLAALTADLRTQGRSWTEIAERIATDERLNMRVAFRFAHGLSQGEVADRYNKLFRGKDGAGAITSKNISYWENWPQSGHEPSLKTLKRLAQLYQCDVGYLIDDGQYSHLDEQAPINSPPGIPANAARTRIIATATPPRDVGQLLSLLDLDGEDDEDSMKRRAFLASVATFAGLGAVSAGTAFEALRHDVNRSLSERQAMTDVADWREIVLEYGQTYPTTAPNELLGALMTDLYGLQMAVQSYRDELAQRELRRVGAMLSAFTAQTIANLGFLRDSRRWWRTARLAADESSDRYTITWVRGREIVRAGFEHRPIESILNLIDETEARMGGSPLTAAMPVFLAGKAQALALIGEPATDSAEETLVRLRECSDKLVPPARGDSVFDWGEEQLRFTESLVYTYLGDYRKADAAQSRALALYPPNDFRSPAQIELQRALCLVGTGDIHGGIRHALHVVASLPARHRVRPVADLGHKVLRAVPVSEQRQGEVGEYRECLDAVFAVPTAELTA